MARKQIEQTEIEAPYELPEGWKWCRLGDYVKISTGKKDANFGSSIGRYPFFTCAITPILCNTYTFDCDAILLAGNGDIGNISRYSGKFEAYQRTYVLETQKGLLKDYLYYSLKFNWVEYNRNKMFGSTIPYIRMGNLINYFFPLPSTLEEQHRIVSRIETLFAKLDQAKEKAQNVVDTFETRKASILHKAFNGELTKKWREENGVGDDSWEEKTLEDVLVEKPRNGYSVVAVDYETPYKSMSLSATTSGYFRPEFYKYIEADITEDSFLWLKKGDILIQRSNSLDKVGTSAIYTGNDKEFIYPDLMMKLQVQENFSNKFIAYELKSEKTMSYFRKNATGTAGNMPKINQKIVCDLQINVSSLPEQTEIVRILDSIFEKETKAKESAEAVLEQIDLLKKSILARAFRGEL